MDGSPNALSGRYVAYNMLRFSIYSKGHKSSQSEFDCSVATWCVLFIVDQILNIKANFIVCCCYDKVEILCEFPTAYLGAICKSKMFCIIKYTLYNIFMLFVQL